MSRITLLYRVIAKKYPIVRLLYEKKAVQVYNYNVQGVLYWMYLFDFIIKNVQNETILSLLLVIVSKIYKVYCTIG